MKLQEVRWLWVVVIAVGVYETGAGCPKSENINDWWKENCFNSELCCHTCHRLHCNTDGNFTNIALNNANLTGTIPDEIVTFNRLQFLRLQDNHLTGSIPPGLGASRSLLYIQLQNNNLTGTIPKSLGSSTREQLTLQGNQFDCDVDDYSELARANDMHSGYGINGTENCRTAPAPLLPRIVRKVEEDPLLWGAIGSGCAIVAGICVVCIARRLRESGDEDYTRFDSKRDIVGETSTEQEVEPITIVTETYSRPRVMLRSSSCESFSAEEKRAQRKNS